MLDYDLYRVYSATSFATGTGVNEVAKDFKGDLKISPNDNYMYMGESAEFSKFPEGRRGKTVVALDGVVA